MQPNTLGYSHDWPLKVHRREPPPSSLPPYHPYGTDRLAGCRRRRYRCCRHHHRSCHRRPRPLPFPLHTHPPTHTHTHTPLDQSGGWSAGPPTTTTTTTTLGPSLSKILVSSTSRCQQLPSTTKKPPRDSWQPRDVRATLPTRQGIRNGTLIGPKLA